MPVYILAIMLLIQDGSASQVDDRLRLSEPVVSNGRIELVGMVSKQNKYSFDLVSDSDNQNIQVNRETKFILDVSGPRVDFAKGKLLIAERGNVRRQREYSIETPLFIRGTFAHKNQFKRFMSAEEKRIGNYEIDSQPFKEIDGGKRIYLMGKLQAGSSPRQLSLSTESENMEVMLAKNGMWHGFSLSELTAGNTGVRVLAAKRSNGEVIASEIHFWPINANKPKSDDQEKPEQSELK